MKGPSQRQKREIVHGIQIVAFLWLAVIFDRSIPHPALSECLTWLAISCAIAIAVHH